MDDKEIVTLFWDRDERAIYFTDQKYGTYCSTISYRILGNREDAVEAVNDTYLRVWNAIPPKRPTRLGPYLGRIIRNLSIDLRRKISAQKRGGGEYEAALEELDQCLGKGTDPEEALLQSELTEYINEFLQSLPAAQRRVFIRRYWHLCSVSEIANQYGYSIAKTRSMLYRTRLCLHTYLQERGVMVD